LNLTARADAHFSSKLRSTTKSRRATHRPCFQLRLSTGHRLIAPLEAVDLQLAT